MFSPRTRLATGTVVALAATLSLSACGNKDGEGSSAESCVDTSGDSIKLGFLNSTSGAMAISEQTVRDSLSLAAEEINADGGIMGKEIEFVEEDGASDPAIFAEKIDKLLTGDCVAAVFGGWTSASRKAMLPVVEANNGLLFYPVQYEGLEASENIYYTGATTNQQIIPAMDFLASEGVETLFLAGSDYVFPRTANKIIKQYAEELGIEIVGEEYVPLDDDDWTTQVAKIVEAKPDFVFNTINGSSNVGFIKAYYEQGLSPETSPIISVSIAEEEAPAMGKDVTGQYAAWNYFQSVESPANETFIAAFQDKYGADRPTSDPMEAAYTSLYLYKALVEKAESFDVEDINGSADGVTFDAPEGTVTIDGDNHLLGYIAYLVEQYRPTDLVCCWDEDWRPEWRVELIPTYKSHRVVEPVAGAPDIEEVPDPLEVQVPIIREVLGAFGIAVVGAAGFEADDVIGSLATGAGQPVDVVTGDRDLFQLVDDAAGVRVLYIGKGVGKHEQVDEAWILEKYAVSAGQYADFATLRGDASDGLPGVKGVGEKTAATLLQRFGDLDGIIAAAADPESDLAPGPRLKIKEAADYLAVAPTVVAVARDIDLPRGDALALPAAPVDPDALAILTERWGLTSSVERLTGVLAG